MSKGVHKMFWELKLVIAKKKEKKLTTTSLD